MRLIRTAPKKNGSTQEHYERKERGVKFSRCRDLARAGMGRTRMWVGAHPKGEGGKTGICGKKGLGMGPGAGKKAG